MSEINIVSKDKDRIYVRSIDELLSLVVKSLIILCRTFKNCFVKIVANLIWKELSRESSAV